MFIAQEEEVEVDEFPVDPDVSLISFSLQLSWKVIARFTLIQGSTFESEK